MKKLNLQDIKQIELNMLKYVHDFCKKQGIKYFLAYGTLLGAVRHRGFIPWDDDIDICMLRSDYEKFIREFESEQYGICIPGVAQYNYPFVKIFDKNTILDETITARKTIFGVYIDIFPLDYFPRDRKVIKKLSHYRNIVDIKNCKWKNNRGILKNLAIYTAKIFYCLCSPEKICKKIDLIASAVPQGEELSDLVWGAKSGEGLPKELFDEICNMKFEDLTFYGLKEYDAYLTKMYGNYMRLPPEEKRVSNHTFDAYLIQNS